MSIVWQEHPILKPPTDEEIAVLEPEDFIELHKVYHEAIANSVRDPYRYGFVLPHWDFADKELAKFATLLLLGANRSGKTSYSARSVVKAALENAESLIYCFAQNNDISITVQQAAIYNYLPSELKQKQLGDVAYVSYSIATGFSNNKIILPNRSQIVFKTYSQYQQDNSILEGMELGSREAKWINIGAWCDEYLRGMEMLDRLYLRLATRGAKLLVTFTPKDGMTETVRYYRDGAIDVETRTTDCLMELHNEPERLVSYVQENEKKDTGIVYFHSKDNPWSGYGALKTQCRARSDIDYTLTALYGQPAKASAGGFPRFGAHNIVKHETINQKGLTRYMCIDPAHARNWFIVWVAVDHTGTWFVYDEWPSTNIGRWAEDKDGKWRIGDGARKIGYGYEQYVGTIKAKEANGLEVFERFIDPRFGASKYSVANSQSDVIQELADRMIVCNPAPGIHEADGLEKISDLMAFDPSKAIDGTNRPSFFISENCKNTIFSIMNYDPLDSGCEALKDPIDCLRYMATAQICHIDPLKIAPQGRFTKFY